MSTTLDLEAASMITGQYQPPALHRLKTKGVKRQMDAFKLAGTIHHTGSSRLGT